MSKSWYFLAPRIQFTTYAAVTSGKSYGQFFPRPTQPGNAHGKAGPTKFDHVLTNLIFFYITCNHIKVISSSLSALRLVQLHFPTYERYVWVPLLGLLHQPPLIAPEVVLIIFIMHVWRLCSIWCSHHNNNDNKKTIRCCQCNCFVLSRREIICDPCVDNKPCHL